MSSRYETGNNENSWFAATRSKLQDRKAGIQAATIRAETVKAGEYRRNATTDKSRVTRSLAAQIREREVD